MDQILAQCVSLFGCRLPSSEKLSEILTDELATFINEFGYERLNVDEIVLAMRLNVLSDIKMPSGIEIEQVSFTGHYVNVAFIAKILQNYCVIRNMVDRKFQNQIDGYE